MIIENIFDVSREIKKKMKEKNLTKYSIAKLSGLNHPSTTRVIDGKHGFTMKNLFVILKVLDLELQIVSKDSNNDVDGDI